MANDCLGVLMEYMGDINGAAAFITKATQNTTTNQNGESIGVL